MNRRWILFLLTLLLVSGIAAISALVLNEMQPGKRQIASGKALIGGPFTLTDHTGRRVSEKDFAGRFMLVFFGYTNCPDVCPAELQVISAALDRLGDRARNVTPVFITLDPERDTVERMADFVSNFHERLIGLTGSAGEIRAAAKVFRVFYAKAKNGASSAEYLMDHSSFVFLMSPKGEYLAHFSYGTGVGTMADGIASFL